MLEVRKDIRQWLPIRETLMLPHVGAIRVYYNVKSGRKLRLREVDLIRVGNESLVPDQAPPLATKDDARG